MRMFSFCFYLLLGSLVSTPAEAQFSFGKLKQALKSQVSGIVVPEDAKGQIPEKFPADWFALKCDSFIDPEMSHAAIEQALLQAPEFSNVQQFLKLHITEIQKGQCPKEWWIYTNDLGTPTHKNSNRYIRVIYKGKDGKCYFSSTIPFRRDYQGNGTYSKPIKYSGASITEVDCETIKSYCK